MAYVRTEQWKQFGRTFHLTESQLIGKALRWEMTRLYLQLTDIYLQKLIDKDVFCYSVKSCALNWTVCTVMAEILWSVLEIMYRSIAKPPIPPVGKPRDLWLFLKNFGHIPGYVASLDGQMPHPFKLQRGSNSPPPRHVKATVEKTSAKFSVTTNSLFSLSSLHTLNKGIFHDTTI